MTDNRDFLIMIHKIAEFTNLSPLVIETGFLLFLTFCIVVVVFLVLAVLRIKNEMIKMSYTINYIARLLERGYKTHKLNKVNYDPETEDIVLEMLQQGKSHNEIRKTIPVSKEYVEIIESVATQKGLLARKPDEFKSE
jgi:cytochrome c-type biogenesis protein CcmH/NrfF